MRKRVLPLAIVCSLACGAGCTNGLGSAFGDPVPDDETSLSALVVSSGTLSPAFDPAVTSYSVRLSEASSVTVIPVTQNPDASITVNGKAVASANPAEALPVADDPVASTITVNAPRAESKTYTVNFYVDDLVVQDAYLKPSNCKMFGGFGRSVAVSGDIIAVGDGNGVYVFEKDINKNWVQTAKLNGRGAGTLDGFGAVVSVSGKVIVVGAPSDSSNQSFVSNSDGDSSLDVSMNEAGAAYVFLEDDNGNWVQDAYLKPSNPDACDNFGISVSINGERIVVGSSQEDSSQNYVTNDNGSASLDNSMTDSGAIYVFARDSDGNWVQDAYLKASNPNSSDYFGGSVSISGDRIVVGAINESSKQAGVTNDDAVASDDNSMPASGAVYVFKKDAVGDWVQDAYLKQTNPDSHDWFGESVAIDGKTIVVGASCEASCQSGIVNVDGEASLDNSLDCSGSVYVFTLNSSSIWIQDAYIKPENPDSNDMFGRCVGINEGYIIVGAWGEDCIQTFVTNNNNLDCGDNSLPFSGSAYLFKKDTSGNWVQDAYLKASNSNTNDAFGSSICIYQDTIIVAAYYEASSQTGVTNADGEASDDNSCSQAGAAYVFKIIP